MAGFLPAFPIILRRMGMTDEAEVSVWSGVLFAAAPFSAAVIGPFWGALGDRIGRKAMVLRALFGVTVFVGAMSFVSSPGPLLALRLAQGVFSGFIAPSLTLVSVHAPLERQGRIAALLQMAVLLGSVVGPPLGGFVLDVATPGALFSMAALGALFSGALVAWLAREEAKPAPPRGGRRIDAVFHALRDLREMLGDPGLRRLLLAIFAVRFGAACVEPVFANYAREFAAESSFVASYFGLANGALVSAASIGNIALLPYWGRRGDRRGHRRNLVLAAAGGALFYAPQALAPDPVSLFAIRLVAGAFLAGTIPAAYGMVAEETPPEKRGSSYSLTFSALAMANSVAPIAGGAVSAVVGVRPLLFASAVPMLLAAFWVASWPRRGRAGTGPVRGAASRTADS